MSVSAADAPAMKAVALREFGGPEVLKYQKIARPEPGDDEVLINVMAASLNPVDAAVREGRFKQMLGEKFPVIPGYDVAGVVEKAGAKVSKLKVGDQVYAYLSLKRGGGYAEYALANEEEASAKPAKLNFEEAAAVPLAASTAWQALVDTAHLSSGQTVLIHGGSGGVGSFALQIAKALGARVIATASAPNQDLLRQLGANVAIDYTQQKFEDLAKDVDVVLDCVGRDTLARSYATVKKGGIIVSIAGRPDPEQLSKFGLRGESILVQPKSATMAELTKLIEAGKIVPIVSEVVPLAEAAAAQEKVAKRHTRGKVVLKVGAVPGKGEERELGSD